jgi:hypothetical protein
VLDVPLSWRNAETLHRLAYLAEGRAVRTVGASTAEEEIGSTDESGTTDT